MSEPTRPLKSDVADIMNASEEPSNMDQGYVVCLVEKGETLVKIGHWKDAKEILQEAFRAIQHVSAGWTTEHVKEELAFRLGLQFNAILQTDQAIGCFKVPLRMLAFNTHHLNTTLQEKALEANQAMYKSYQQLDDTDAVENSIDHMYLTEPETTVNSRLYMLLDYWCQHHNTIQVCAARVACNITHFLPALTEQPPTACNLKMIAACYGILCISYMAQDEGEKAKEYWDLFMKTWSELDWPPEEYDIITNWFDGFFVIYDPIENFQFGYNELEFMAHQIIEKWSYLEIPRNALANMFKCHAINYSLEVDSSDLQIARKLFQWALHAYSKSNNAATAEMNDNLQIVHGSIGDISFDLCDSPCAIEHYTKLLELLEQYPCTTTVYKCKVAQTKAMLAHVSDQMQLCEDTLKYYEEALELREYLDESDQVLIECNLPGSYHIKAANCKERADMLNYEKYMKLSESSFVEACSRYSKSYLYVSYGLYLIDMNKLTEAVSVLNTAKDNGIQDQEIYILDKCRNLTVPEDLKNLLESHTILNIPAIILALYLKIHALIMLKERGNAESVIDDQLLPAIEKCDYEHYTTSFYITPCTTEQMHTVCKCLLESCYKQLEYDKAAKVDPRLD